MATAITELGFTKEEIEQKVVNKIAEELMTEYVYDDEEGERPESTRLAQHFRDVVRKRLDRELERLCETYIVPNVRQIIESVTLQKTNDWGEKIGESQTFVEYLTKSAQDYLSQPVDFEGKPTTRNSYNRNEQTRLVHLVHRHLHYSIETAMSNAVEIVKGAIQPALEETVKLKLSEIAGSMKVQLTTKK